MLLTFGLVIPPSALFVWTFASDGHTAIALVGALSTIVVLASFSYAACSDPGIVYRGDVGSVDDDRGSLLGGTLRGAVGKEGDGDALVECSVCDMMRPGNSRHCYACGVCVYELDHHWCVYRPCATKTRHTSYAPWQLHPPASLLRSVRGLASASGGELCLPFKCSSGPCPSTTSSWGPCLASGAPKEHGGGSASFFPYCQTPYACRSRPRSTFCSGTRWGRELVRSR